MAKIWLKIWPKVKENGTKKNQIGENGGERKRNPSANPVMLKNVIKIEWNKFLKNEFNGNVKPTVFSDVSLSHNNYDDIPFVHFR